MWGGNLPSLLAGEIGYSIGLGLLMVYLGAVQGDIDQRRHPIRNALLLALVGLAHGCTLLFAVLAGFIWLFHRDVVQRGAHLLKIYALSFCLLGFWIVPLILFAGYNTTHNMVWIIERWQEALPPILAPLMVLCLVHLAWGVTRWLKGRAGLGGAGLHLGFIALSLVLYLAAFHLNVIDIRFLPLAWLALVPWAALAGADFSRALTGRVLTPLLGLTLCLLWVAHWVEYIPKWVQWNYRGYELAQGWPDFKRLNDYLQGGLGDPRVLHEHADLLERFEKAGGGAIRNRAEALLRSLGFDEDAWGRPMELLSGGQRKLIGIARCLLGEPDLLLLDEPDNHLDLDRKAMLEQVIRGFDGCVVVVSHDRYLLDETVNVICELDYSREAGVVLKRWEGNYTSYVTQRELALLKQQQDFVAQQKEVQRLEAAIARFKLWASIVIDERHIKQARNKQRQIDSMEKVERPVLERRKMSLNFRPANRGGAKAVELRHLEKAFGEKVIMIDANATIMNGERVGIVGPNGAGKSVLLKLILGQLPADGGEVWTGPSIRTGYYSQEHETLNFSQTPVEALREVKPMYEGEAVAQLQRFLLPYDATNQRIATLSGGEKSRVQLARMMQLGANCLVLDEPTNNLDIPAAEVLEEALEKFQGAVIVVSHDRYLLDRLVDRVFEVRDGEMRVFEGGYSDYAARRQA
jgi:ATP-binding cassette subfamily F protein 3